MLVLPADDQDLVENKAFEQKEALRLLLFQCLRQSGFLGSKV